jgi:hypothetical protein
MRKLLIGLMVLGLAGVSFGQIAVFRGYLKQSTATTVLVGPFMDHADNHTPITVDVAALHVLMEKGDGTVAFNDNHVHASATDNDLVLTAIAGPSTSFPTLSSGTFEIAAANVDTLGDFKLVMDVPGVTYPLVYFWRVVAAKPFNMQYSGTVDVDTILTAAPSEATEIAAATIDTALTVPTAGASPDTPTLAQAISWLYSRWFNKSITTTTEYQLFKRNETDKIYEQTITDTGSELTVGEARAAD